MSRPDVLLISTADWDNPFWTNKQHVAVQLARRGHRVFYVESLGLRRPSASKKDLARIWRRLLRGLKRPRLVRENIWVWSPLVLPFHNFSIARRLNRTLISGMMRLWLQWLNLKPSLLWTYSPLTSALFDLEGYDAVVYHAVDDVAAQPGMPREAIQNAEAELKIRADAIFVTALSLLDTHQAVNQSTYYFPNVADFDHFAIARDEATVVPPDLAAIPGPRLGLIGAISDYKVDFDLLIAVAKRRPAWSIVLIGAVGEGDPWTDASRLAEAPNLILFGPRPYEQLPAYLKGIDVAILANRANEYTRSMFPMKFFEYLAAGRPVVATPLPALVDYHDVALFCDGPDAFIAGVEAVLEGKGPSLDLRTAAARANTYEGRMGKMMTIVEQLRPRARGASPKRLLRISEER